MPRHAIACVSFLNSKPLIEPLLANPNLDLKLAVPSQLLSMLERGEASTGLLSIVDYQLSTVDLLLVPAGAIGCDGPTLTVRIFSKVPIHQITTLHGDPDSHTSVILAQVILRETYKITPQMLSAADRRPEAMLLIGDKVVNAARDPAAYPHQLDLGEAWKTLTGLPFIFACWMMRADQPSLPLARTLNQARLTGATMIDALVQKYAPEKHWPPDLARKYFTQYLRYDLTPRGRLGIDRFFDLAAKHNLLAVPRRPQYLEL